MNLKKMTSMLLNDVRFSQLYKQRSFKNTRSVDKEPKRAPTIGKRSTKAKNNVSDFYVLHLSFFFHLKIRRRRILNILLLFFSRLIG